MSFLIDAASAQMERKEVFTPYELASDVGVVVHASGRQLVVDCVQPTEAVTRTITSSIHHLEVSMSPGNLFHSLMYQ